MNHIEKEKLIKADIASIENRVRHAFNQGYDLGYKEGKANCSEIPKGSPKYCDRSICLKNGYNNVGCEDCEVTKSQESSGDNVVSRDVVKKQMIMYGFHAPDMTVTEFVEDLPSVTPQEPFKPMVEIDLYSVIKQKYIERDVLDKIRAEIKHFMYDINPSSSESDYACNYILDILDKYKAESEK